VRGLVLQKAYDLFYELTLLCNRSPFAVEKVIAATIAPKRQGNGLVLWNIQGSKSPERVPARSPIIYQTLRMPQSPGVTLSDGTKPMICPIEHR
jgi:hypothetical protein